MKILELGGGIGEGTRMLVKSLYARPNDPGGILRCSRYDVTDISAGSFDFARFEFRKHSSQIMFGTLDIEKDFADQGFPEGQYDVVFAMGVLHVSTDLPKTLQRARKALKPGGKLIFQEPLDPNGWTFGFVFSLFPGWWVGENDNRRLSPRGQYRHLEYPVDRKRVFWCRHLARIWQECGMPRRLDHIQCH